MPIHDTYGLPSLPELQVVRLEENIAEKISRLGRTPTARDLYDLAWLVTHQRDIGNLDTDLIGRLAVLNIWVDAHGVTAGTVHWRAGHQPRPFDPDHCAIPTSGRLRNPLRVVVEQAVGADIQCGGKGFQVGVHENLRFDVVVGNADSRHPSRTTEHDTPALLPGIRHLGRVRGPQREEA